MGIAVIVAMSKESDAGEQCLESSLVRYFVRAGFRSVSTMYQKVEGMVFELDLNAFSSVLHHVLVFKSL